MMDVEIQNIDQNSLAVLKLLRGRKDVPEQVQTIAELLGLSPQEVQSAVETLKSRGYEIVDDGRCGICLPHLPETLYPWDVTDGLKAHYVGHPLRVFKVVDSTNAFGEKWAMEGAPDGAVVVGEQQTAGRGRFDRRWSSPAETGIYFSIIFKPDMPMAQVPMLTLMASAAVAEGLADTAGVEAEVKWPNDVLVKGRKICGIRAESRAARGGRAVYVVVGIGINVNHTEKDFPEDLLAAATSVYLETGKRIFRARLLQRILELTEEYYEAYKRDGFPWLRETWMKRNCTMGRTVKVNTNSEGIVEGETIGISSQGGLLVRTGDNRVREFLAGDVSIGSKNFR